MIGNVLDNLPVEPSKLLAVNTTTAMLLFGLVVLLATREILFGAERSTPGFLLRMEKPLDVIIAPLAVVFLLILVAYAVSSSA